MRLATELAAQCLAGQPPGPTAKPRKYNNNPVTVGGLRFDSKKEYARWLVLQMLERDGQIHSLRRQVRYDLTVNGLFVCTYVADHVYHDCAKEREVIEDVKGYRTAIYKLKKKLMLAVHGVDILEI